MTLPPLAHDLLAYLGRALLLSAEQLLLLFGPALLLALLMHLVSNVIRNRAGLLLGDTLHIWLTAPGTVVHELGHALFCVLFGHQIREISLFRPRPNGVLGFVKHTWNRRSLYQNAGNFFIGTGPIWLGIALILLLCYALLGPQLLEPLRSVSVELAGLTTWGGMRHFGVELGQALWALLGLLGQGEWWREWRFWLFLYLLFCIGSHITLSSADLAGAWTGLLVIVALVLVFNLATLWLGDFALAACLRVAQVGAATTVLLLFTLLLNLALAGLLCVCTLFR